MASGKLSRSRLPKSEATENDPKGLMAEIDSGAVTGDGSPVAMSPTEPVPEPTPVDAPVEEPPDNPPAYTPPITEKWGKLMSRVNYPLPVPHQEGEIRLSPRAILTVDGNKLGTVPNGARFVPDRR